MIKLFLLLLLFYSAVSVAGVCNSKLAASYASAIANTQYLKNGISIKGPFEVKSVDEITGAYFKEVKIKKHEPVEIYAVSLKSSDQWECLYYVTLSSKCDFKAISFHHCAK